MTVSRDPNYTHVLRQLMQQVGVSSYKQLSQLSGISEKQLRRLRQGKLSQLRVETVQKLAQTLQLSASEFLKRFTTPDAEESPETVTALKQEYIRLQQQMAQQREALLDEFQQSSLQVLESWLIQWPTVAYKVQQNPELPAVRLLPLVRPVEQLLEEWGVEAIAPVGSELLYDPQWHQLIEGTAQPGELVQIRYTGYRLKSKLLYRAKVSPISNANKA
ncbi:MAG TPA: helix-turn-helix domain-containing protein [Coleofasciculaceae cyanobacterium]